MRNNRRAGHQFERDIASEYRELGFDEACCTRYSSRVKDDCGIDIDFVVPFAIQCKYMKNQPDFYKLLNSIKKVPTEMPIVHFKRNVGKGKPKEEIVAMKKEDFYELVRMLKTENIL